MGEESGAVLRGRLFGELVRGFPLVVWGALPWRCNWLVDVWLSSDGGAQWVDDLKSRQDAFAESVRNDAVRAQALAWWRSAVKSRLRRRPFDIGAFSS